MIIKQKQYPYIEYDNNDKTIYVGLKHIEPDQYLISHALDAWGDYNKEHELTGVEILLPSENHDVTI